MSASHQDQPKTLDSRDKLLVSMKKALSGHVSSSRNMTVDKEDAHAHQFAHHTSHSVSSIDSLLACVDDFTSKKAKIQHAYETSLGTIMNMMDDM